MGKNTFTVLIATLLVHSVALAASAPDYPSKVLCSESQMKDILYSSFMQSSHMLKHRYSAYYQKISADTDQAFQSLCKISPDGKVVSLETEVACAKSCDKNATDFFQSMLPTKGKEKELFNECALLCRMASQSMWNFLLGADRAKTCNSELARLKETVMTEKASVAGFAKMKATILEVADKVMESGSTGGNTTGTAGK